MQLVYEKFIMDIVYIYCFVGYAFASDMPLSSIKNLSERTDMYAGAIMFEFLLTFVGLNIHIEYEAISQLTNGCTLHST